MEEIEAILITQIKRQLQAESLAGGLKKWRVCLVCNYPFQRRAFFIEATNQKRVLSHPDFKVNLVEFQSKVANKGYQIDIVSWE